MSSEPATFTEETASNLLKELQSWWEVPSMAQYISLFREAFHLPEIEIEELENGLIDDCIKGPNEWLENLVVAFLKSIMPGRVNLTNWDNQLQKLIKRKWSLGPYAEKEHPFQEDKSFHELDLRHKVEILYCFCLYRLDNNDITDVMKSMDAEALRVQKLGFDDAGNTYWYFYGTRLYKEEPIEEKKTWNEEWQEQKRKSLAKKRGRGRPPKKQNNENNTEDTIQDERFMNVSPKSRWSVVCDTLEEWVNFAEKFKTSKSKNEKNLFQIIQENFLPTLNKIYEEKEKKLQQKIKELLPPREKIVTRRETRKMRGETGGEINYALLNGYDSDEDYRQAVPNDEFKMVKSRAERLEERNRRASEAQNVHKRAKYDEDFNEDFDEESSENSNSSESSDADLKSQMEKLLSTVKLHKDAWPFLHPVQEEEAPGYYDIIKEPVDLSTIENRLKSNKYETVGDLDEDFSKMVSNCELYNGENHTFSKMAQTLRKLFRKEVAKLLETLETIQSSNPDSEENNDENNDSQYHSSSNSSSSSPPHESHVVESKKVKSKKKKRKRGNMEALDLLAQASDIAVQNSNSNDMLNISNMHDEQKKCSDFPNLKILPIHSHPLSLIEKFSSVSSKENVKENNSEINSLYTNEKMYNDGLYQSSSPTDSAISSSSEPLNYMNNLTHFTNFIEKDSDKNLNILSNSDVTSVLQENETINHNSAVASSLFKNSVSSGNPHSVDNILDGYSENFISHFMKQPTNYPGITQNKYSYEETFSKLDMNLNRKAERSSGFADYGIPDNSSLQDSADLQYNPESPSDNITTIDASVLGISLNPRKKKPKNSDRPEADVVRSEKASSDSSQNEAHVKNSHSFISKQTSPPNAMDQQDSSNYEQTIDVPVTSQQAINFNYINPIKSLPPTFVTNHSTFTNGNLPLHMPLSYAKAIQQQDKIQLHSGVSSANDSSNFFNSEQTVCAPVSSYQNFNLGLSNSSSIMPVTFNQMYPLNSSLQYSTTSSKTDQQQTKTQKQSLNNSIVESFNPAADEQTIPSYQPNFNFTYSNSTLPTTYASTFAANYHPNLPLHIPATYPKTVEQQASKSPTNPFELSLPKPYNPLIFDPVVSKGSSVTYHIYSQNKPSHSSGQEHLNYLNNETAPIHMAPCSEKRICQEDSADSPLPSHENSPVSQEICPASEEINPTPEEIRPASQGMRPVPQEIRPVVQEVGPSHQEVRPAHQEVRPVLQQIRPALQQMRPAHQEVRPVLQQMRPALQEVRPAQQEIRPAPNVPSSNMPCNATNVTSSFSPTAKISVPVTSSNFISVTSSPQGLKKNPQGVTKISVPVTSSNFITVTSPQGVMKNLQGVTRNPQAVTRNPQGVTRNPQGVIKNQQGVTKNQQGVTKISVPVTSSSFISVNTSPQAVMRNKPVIVTARPSGIEKGSSPVDNVASSSLNTISNKTNNNNILQTNTNQPFSPKTHSVILSASPPTQNQLRIHNNPMPSVSLQSNMCMPNGLPVMQQVVIPAGTQIPNTGQQIIFTTPQNTIRILSKEQSAQLQNSVGQLNQGFVKVVPQLISSAPGVQSFQLQTLSPNSTQAFTQVTQNPQFVNVPYMVSNQNSIVNSTSQPTVNYQPFQISPRPMHIGGQGNS